MIVDCHTHIGEGVYHSCSPDELLAAMDASEIAQAVVCPVDRCLAVENAEGNDYVLTQAAKHPGRFIPFATANPWYGAKAVAELQRAIAAGARGLKLNSKVQGFTLSDDVVYPLIEVAGEHNLPVFVHTATMVCAEPLQLAMLARRFPAVNFIMGHSGSTDFWNDMIPGITDVKNIYLDTSVNNPSSIGKYCTTMGPDRLCFGTDYPQNTYPIELEKMGDAIPDEQQRQIVLSQTILRLLGEGVV